MDYDDIDVEQVVNEVVAAEAHGKLRPATKRESMTVRLAALSEIVHNLQDIVESDPGFSDRTVKIPVHTNSAAKRNRTET